MKSFEEWIRVDNKKFKFTFTKILSSGKYKYHVVISDNHIDYHFDIKKNEMDQWKIVPPAPAFILPVQEEIISVLP